MMARAVFVMHKAAAHNLSSSKYKALRRMGLCSGSASSNSDRAALSVYAWTVPTWAALLDRTGCRKPDGVGYTRIDCEWGVNGSGPEGAAGNVPSWVHINQTCCKYG